MGVVEIADVSCLYLREVALRLQIVSAEALSSGNCIYNEMRQDEAKRAVGKGMKEEERLAIPEVGAIIWVRQRTLFGVYGGACGGSMNIRSTLDRYYFLHGACGTTRSSHPSPL